MPPSAEVREAQATADQRKRVRRAKGKYLAPWILFAVSSIVMVAAVDRGEQDWAYGPLLGLYTALIFLAHTWDADRVYQRAYDAGISTGILVSTAINRHVMDHRLKGEEPCDVGMASVAVPHIWEHRLTRPEIILREPDDDEDEDQEFNHRPRS